MKKVFVFTAAVLMAASARTMAQSSTTSATTHSNSEYISIGPVAGFGDNWVSNLGATARFQPSGYVGIGLVYARNEHWGWGGQVQLSAEGYNVKDGNGYTASSTPLYIRVPLRGYYFFGDYRNTVRPKIYLGPSFGFKVGESDNGYNGADQAMAANLGTFRSFDLGVNVGAGVNIKLAKSVWLNMDLGYTQGVLDAIKDDAGKYNTNQNLAFNAGILFGIK
jgi:hypothetical protein